MDTSYRVVELVRQKISSAYVTASDTDVARVLGVSRTAISNYKHEKQVMSDDTLAKAQELLHLPDADYFGLMLSLKAEGESDPSLQDTWVRLHRLVRTTFKNGRAASFALVAIVAGGMGLASPGNQASNARSDVSHDIHYANKRRRRSLFDRLKKFLFIFPVTALATGCSALAPRDDWSPNNTRAEIVYQVANAWDAVQTNQWQYRDDVQEGNISEPFIGKEPSTRDVLMFHSTMAISHYLISRALPPKWRAWWQGTTGVAASANAIRNCVHFDAGC